MIQWDRNIMYANMTQFEQKHNRSFLTDDCVGERYCSWPWTGCGTYPCARATTTVLGIWPLYDTLFSFHVGTQTKYFVAVSSQLDTQIAVRL